jgi:hypothetical protein
MLRPVEASTANYTLSDQEPTVEAIASVLDATNGNREPAPQTAADEQESHGRVHDVKIDGDHTVESKGSEFSPGKDPSLSVANYVSQIGQNWQRGVDAFMTIARLCAEASARLTITETGELLKQLPFGDSAFSKFVQIGNDRRLNTPELRRLLPPHYTITYAVTLLTDQELQDAIAAKVIHPDMNRDDLQRWRNSHRKRLMKVGSALSPKEAASDSTVAGAPIASTQDAAEQKAAGPATDSGDLAIPQADDLERAFANAGALVRQRFWAKYAPGSASTTPGADEALAILAEFAKFVIARIGCQGKNIIVTVTEADADQFRSLAGLAKLAIAAESGAAVARSR